MMSPSPKLLLHGRVTTPVETLADASILVEDGRIEWVREGRASVPGATDLSNDGDVIVPGFIDLHVNGFGGYDLAGGGNALAAVAKLLPRTGVTSFLPTLISSPPVDGARFARAAAAFDGGGARVLGAHLEGPFLSPDFRGAHDPSRLLIPEADRVRELAAAKPRLVTLAPELPGCLEAIRVLVTAGAVVAAGHTGATAEQAVDAVGAGVRFATHLFNAMPRWHHRAPGAAAALLADERVTVGLIADGVHVHSAAIEVAVLAAGAARVALTTDQTSAAGLPAGRHSLGGRSVSSDGWKVTRDDGTLAGTAATMDALIHLVAGLRSSGVPEAVEMASLTPARLLGVDGRLGRIREGHEADIVVLDSALRVRLTLVRGQIAYGRNATGDAGGRLSGTVAS